MGRYVPILVYP